MAYLELVLRCVTQRGLLRAVLHFLFAYEYDGVRVVDVLLRRLEGNSQLSLVSLCLMETLIDLNCEDVMIDLVFKHLLNGHHLMVNHRHKIADPEPYREAAVAFLSLTPRCCARPLNKTREWVDEMAHSGRRVLDFKQDEDSRKVNGVHDGIAMKNLVHEVRFNYGNPNETLYANYHAYLCDARFEIVSRTIACINWSSKYHSVTSPKRETNNNTKETRELVDVHALKEQDSLISCTSGYDTLKNSDTSDKEPHSLTSLLEQETEKVNADLKEQDSVSLGESSDYESFRYKEDNDEENFAEDVFTKSVDRVENPVEYDGEVTLVRSWRASAESIIGPLLSSLLKKTAAFLEAEVMVNGRVTSVISKLVSLPTPLLTSLLLCPSFLLQPNVPSLYQILSKLKEDVDELTTGLDNTIELVDKARVFLIQREMALVNSRAPASDDGKPSVDSPTHKPEDSPSPFRRVEAKRRSISSSLSNMFGRRASASPSQHNLQSLQPTTYQASPQKRLIFTQEEYWSQSITLRSILNAVLLEEWLKELAALCEEHALRLSADNYEDDTYIRSVLL